MKCFFSVLSWAKRSVAGSSLRVSFAGVWRRCAFKSLSLSSWAWIFVPHLPAATLEVLDLLGTGLRGQGASAEFGPKPIEPGALPANALIEAAPGRARAPGIKLKMPPAEILHEAVVRFDWFVAALNARFNVPPTPHSNLSRTV